MPGKKNSPPKQVTYCYDESLPPFIGNALKAAGFPVVLPVSGIQDEVLIPEMGRMGQAWITKDDRSKTEHEPALAEARISVVWVRGLTHERRKRGGSVQRNASLKDTLRMLVNKLDRITDEIGRANGPRYFLIYTTTSRTEQDRLDVFTTLREVHERLAGLPRRER